MLWSYGEEIKRSKLGSTMKINVDVMLDGTTYFVEGKGSDTTFISDQHKGLMEAIKELMSMAEQIQCIRHIYANFQKKFKEVVFNNLFWMAAKC
uniref:Uncharacterized protein n=1 Tax=Lactuca sativa TaxID=4236 RepID=A0A9R1VIS2_LACSA|nr:hypothetical protein LSAT_V11C500290120 [Lactuca sativa]